MLSPRESSMLDWFYGEGISAFERSTFGPILERAEAFHVPGWWNMTANDITARPTAEVRHHGGVEPDHKLLVRYGEVSRRLQCCSPAARAALEAFHGDLGAKWARHERGRYVSLFGLTRSGMELIRQARRMASKSALELSDQERLQNEINADQISGSSSTRRALIGRALLEAKKIYTAASNEYVATGAAKGA